MTSSAPSPTPHSSIRQASRAIPSVPSRAHGAWQIGRRRRNRAATSHKCIRGASSSYTSQSGSDAVGNRHGLLRVPPDPLFLVPRLPFALPQRTVTAKPGRKNALDAWLVRNASFWSDDYRGLGEPHGTLDPRRRALRQKPLNHRVIAQHKFSKIRCRPTLPI
jgi:hypothetical protein